MRGLILLALSGCNSILGIESFMVADARDSDAAETGFCLGPKGKFRICLPIAPTSQFENPSMVNVPTDTFTRCASSQPENWKAAQQPDACFLIGTDIVINGEMRFTGSRPVVLFAANTITISAPIDVASHNGAQPGAGSVDLSGAPSPACIAPKRAGANPIGAGGGAGGSYSGKGGDGGPGTASSGTRGEAGNAVNRPEVLRGGCPGGGGGDGQAIGGQAGAGGGAIYLVAGGKISINSPINASGAGGDGGSVTGGGSGGGSGGMIVLSGPAIAGNDSGLAASGGGGGGGGGQAVGGMRGGEALPSFPAGAAAGGSATNGGGKGGDGAAGTLNPTAGSAASNGGGGGGGGSVGIVLLSTVPTRIATSPPFVLFDNP